MTKIAFLITTRYQVYHYAAIAKHLPPATFIIEVRDHDYEVSEEFVREHIPSAVTRLVPKSALRSLDGRHDVIVCQTPVLPQVLFDETMIVAQQYSLAKETYQYGIWRSLANLNLMYGDYSVEKVSGFCNAIAAGNPMFDRWDHDRSHPDPPAGPISALYMPTYGELSSIPQVAPRLAGIDGNITVKLHHSERPEMAALLPDNCTIAYADADPLSLLEKADVVISDFSGAAFDALYARRPLVLVGELDQQSAEMGRLSDTDIGRDLLDGLGVTWEEGRSIADVTAEAHHRLAADSHLDEFTDLLFSNHGSAGKACADAIQELLEHGEPRSFSHQQVRNRNREMIERARYLEEQNRKLARQAKLGGFTVQSSLSNLTHRLRRHTRPLIAKSPVLERVALQTRQSHLARKEVRSLRKLNRHPAGPTNPELAATLASGGFSVVAAERRREVLDLVSEAFVSNGIRVAIDDNSPWPLCALLDSQKPIVLQALNSLGAEHPELEVRARVNSNEGSRIPASDLALSDIFTAHSLHVGIPLTYKNYAIDQVGFVDMVFVQYLEAKARVISNDPRIARVDWTDEFHDVITPTAESVRVPPATTPASLVGPVDIVYTWVDSSDEKWRERYENHIPQHESNLISAANAERFIDREELRYSLRSIWLNAPFVRHVYLVTADQRPEWLNEDCDRLTVVSHSDIFPDPSMLPTFNSHAIEACLHRIEGLSEHFIYMNDDVFLGRELAVDDFFTRAGLARVRFEPAEYIYSGEPPPGAIPTEWAAYNAAAIVKRDYGIAFDRKLQHVAHSQRRSVLAELETRYPEEFEHTRRARLRSRGDLSITSMFAPYYSVATSRAVESPLGPNGYLYADTGRRNFARQCAAMIRQPPQMFCLNSTRWTEIDLETQAKQVIEFLDGIYPFASPFERQATATEARQSGADRPGDP